MLIVLGLAAPAVAQYGGPAILSRGEAPAAMNVPTIEFRPFGGISAGYSTGLAGVYYADSGNLPNYSSPILTANWGVSGTHSWQHTKLGLDYSGTMGHYIRQSAFDSISQSISLGLAHQFTRHVTLFVAQTGGILSRDNSLRGLQQTVPFDPSTSYLPRQDYFDNRTLHTGTQAHLTVQRSTRTSYSLGGGYFYVAYRSKALNGADGYNGSADVQYRLSRRVTVGTTYTYGHFTFRRVFGGTDLHSVTSTLAIALTRTVEFSGYAGPARVESKFTRSVPLDPAIVALLGISSGVEVVHSVRYIPYYAARLSKTFRTGVISGNAGHSVVPGNGLFLTSYSTTVGASYGYTGLRLWSFNSSFTYSRNSSVGDVAGGYRTMSGGFTISRKITKSLHFTAHTVMRKYSSPSFTNYNRTVTDSSIGLGFAPGEIPLRVW